MMRLLLERIFEQDNDLTRFMLPLLLIMTLQLDFWEEMDLPLMAD